MENKLNKAIYPGSFDPITNGHLDVIERSTKVFDMVDVVITYNPNKTGLFSVAEKLDILKKTTAYLGDAVTVHTHHGLAVDYCEKSGIYTIVRGLSAMSDIDFEFQMALTNRQLNRKVDMVLFVSSAKYTYLSSSLIKEIASFGGDVSGMVPPYVEEKLKEKFQKAEK